MKKITLLAALIVMAGFVSAQTTWKVDKGHSNIQFTVIHNLIAEVNGEFKDFDGVIVSEGDSFKGTNVEFTIQTASINTGIENRDKHLRGEDFFNAEQYPEIKFKGILHRDNGVYSLKGDLTMRDVTKKVSFDVTYRGTVDTGKGIRAGFRVNGKINRLDYGVKWSNKLATGELVVADEVDIIARLELIKVVPTTGSN
jgi:polyisoprenoid-binding protein YceI